MQIAVVAAAILSALHVISLEAKGDGEFLREIQAQVAEVSSSSHSIIISTPVPSIDRVPPQLEGARHSEQLAPLSDPAAARAAEQGTQETEPEALAPLEDAPDEEAADLCARREGAVYCLYAVQDGDTLWAIADILGVESGAYFTAAELLAMSNGLNDAQNWLIVPGQELRIPLATGVIHTVVEGESIGILAEIFGVSGAEVIAANALADPNGVVAGMELLIPSPSLWPWAGVGDAVALVEETETEAAGSEEATEDAEANAEEAEANAEDAAEAGEVAEDAAAGPETATPPPLAAFVPAAPTSPNANPSVGEVRDLFAAGYIAAGGPAQHLERILSRVIPCESGYNLRAYNPAGPFYGLMQFLGETWARSGGGDWFDAWQQGHNTGVLLQRSTPHSQWPHCWG